MARVTAKLSIIEGFYWGFPGSSAFKNSPAMQETRLSGSGRSAGEETGYPLQYSWVLLWQVEERADTTGSVFEDSGIICEKARFQPALRCADNLEQSKRYQEVLVAADQESLVARFQGHNSRGVPV